jgi:hypothetical protein
VGSLHDCGISFSFVLRYEAVGILGNENGIIQLSLAQGAHSTSSLSLLPASPQIFHGRESELRDLVDTLLADAARVAILGPGGIGKTTLAMAALHHSTIMDKYYLRHFISCESSNTGDDLVNKIGVHLGLEPSRRLSMTIVQHLGQCGPCIVVLDNFETSWEPLDSRDKAEELISSLADIPTLALVVRDSKFSLYLAHSAPRLPCEELKDQRK